MPDSLKEQVAQALLAKLQTVTAFKRVTREQADYDGVKQTPASQIPAASLIERSFTSKYTRPGDFPDVVRKETSVSFVVSIYLVGDAQAEKTLNNLTASVVAAFEADQTLGGLARGVECGAGDRLVLPPITAQNIQTRVVLVHDASTL